jgi:hypothetical protein
MSKILVEVFIPAAGRRFDLMIPYEARLHEVTELVKSVVADDVESSFMPAEDTILCHGVTGAALDINRSPEELGLANGAALMLL